MFAEVSKRDTDTELSRAMNALLTVLHKLDVRGNRDVQMAIQMMYNQWNEDEREILVNIGSD